MLLLSKVAVITGAAAGIGEEIAKLFALEGARVILLDRNGILNGEIARGIGPAAHAITCDVRRREEVFHALAEAARTFDAIDILVNNAGIYPRQSFLNMTEQQWDEVQTVNLKAMFHTCQAVLPAMLQRRSGKLINISSVTFHLGAAELTHYVASKGGVIGLTRSLARELGPHGVHVNCVTPGAVLVEAEKAVATAEQVDRIVEQQCLKRRVMPIDIARACLFLGSELSDGMTGQTLNIDGGWAMH